MPPDSRLDSAAPLPALPSAFIGRAETVRGLLAAVARTRLLTLTGVGGVGKTRLAIETARSLCVAEDVEVAFVDLAPLRDPLQVVPAAAAALAVREEPGREPLASIVAALGERRVILLLDNREHLLDASAALAGALIAACPRLNILATSRERLRIDGEHVYEVAPLELPDAMPY